MRVGERDERLVGSGDDDLPPRGVELGETLPEERPAASVQGCQAVPVSLAPAENWTERARVVVEPGMSG